MGGFSLNVETCENDDTFYMLLKYDPLNLYRF